MPLQSKKRPLKTMGRYLILVGGLLLLLLWPGLNCYATTLYSQTLYPDTFNLTAADENYIQKLGNGLTGELQKICFRATSPAEYIYRLQLDYGPDNVFEHITNTPILWHYDDLPVIPTSGNEIVCADIKDAFVGYPGPYTLDSDNYYFLDFTVNVPNTKFYGSTDGNAYLTTSTDFFYNHYNTDYGDIYFELNDSYTGSPPSDISFIFPVNGTSTPDFAFWGIGFNYYATTTDWGVSINYAATSTDLLDPAGDYYTDSENFEGAATSSAGSYFTKTHVFDSSEWDTTQYARAVLWNYDNLRSPSFEVIASTTIISFTITGENPLSGGYYGYYVPGSTPTSTATSSEWVIICDPTDPLFTRSICQISKWTIDALYNLMKFLFYPKSSDFAKLNELKTMIISKPPVGYFYLIKNAFNFNSTSTKAFDFSTSTAAMVEPIFNPIKTGLTFILWLLFSFWLFNRIKNLNL